MPAADPHQGMSSDVPGGTPGGNPSDIPRGVASHSQSDPFADDLRGALEAVFKEQFSRLIAGLLRWTHDLDLAEELAQDALVAALEQWPSEGVPRNPGAWLTATAKRRAIDRFRRQERQQRKYAEIGRALETEQEDEMPPVDDRVDAASSLQVADDLLRLMFTACHPVLTSTARVALTLRLLGGLTTDEIARAFLVPESTVAQRIVRAKKTLAREHVRYEVPVGPELWRRLDSVLDVVYLIFNEGYSASSGQDWIRPALCGEAIRLGRVLAALLPDAGEVHGLVALLEIQASRLPARTDPHGQPVLLLDQDRSRWDGELIDRGLMSLARADAVAVTRGPFHLQAAIAACHARARAAEQTDWQGIVALYDNLAVLTPSPIVELNRAVAVSMASGPAAALPLIEGLGDEAALAGYHLLPSVYGDMLYKLGRFDEARAAFERAVALTRNAQDERLLRRRIAACSV